MHKKNKILSYVNGASDKPLLFKTVWEILKEAADSHPEKAALISHHQNRTLSYKELLKEAGKVANGLLNAGLRKGDRIGIWAPNCIEWVLLQFASAKIGAILVTINPAYRKNELRYALNKVQCKILVMASSFKTSDYVSMIKEIAPGTANETGINLDLKELPHLKSIFIINKDTNTNINSFEYLINSKQTSSISDIELDPDEDINIQFTSGTTGSPKGATLTHFNIVNNGFFVGEAMRFSHQDILCVPVPLYHCFGMVMGILTCVSHKSTIVLPDYSFDASTCLEAIDKYKCTAIHGVPTMFVAMLENPDFSRYMFSSLRTGIMAGAPCPIEVMKKVQSNMHVPEITIAYGMTETSPVSFQSATDDPLERRVSTVGKVQPHIQVKIIDENGKVVDRGTKGELCTRGYSVMKGYWDDYDKTNEVLTESGWMKTGDLAIIDDSGYGNIVGRVKDMIIRGGENIYPREIEEFLYTHDCIQDVSVFGLPDTELGEIVAAWIKLKQNKSLKEEDVKNFCKNEIAHFKIPARIKFVEEFPMTVSGKIKKFEMRDAMIKELGLETAATA